MSSDESNQHRSDESHSDDPLKEKKVCFICGSHTIFIINIHEPRSGPNMIDVVTEKFKMRPLNDDKFLCYSCNNWLINWYSMQNKYDRHNETDSSSAASTAREIATASGGRSGGNTSSSSGNSSDQRSAETAAGNRRRNAHIDSNRRKCTKRGDSNDGANERTMFAKNYLSRNSMLNGTHDTVNDDEASTTSAAVVASTATVDDNEEILFTAAIQAVRTKLQKYLYCPNKRKRDATNDDDDDDDDDDNQHMPLGAFNHHRSRIDYEDRLPKMVCPRQRCDPAPDAENRQQHELIQPRKRYKHKCCELCKRPMLRSTNHCQGTSNCQMRRQKTIRLCRKCKLSMHMHICNRLTCLRPNRRPSKYYRKMYYKERKNSDVASSSNSIEDNDILNGSNIVNKLKLLGTTIYYETEECLNRKQHRNIDELSNDDVNDGYDDWHSIHSISSTNEIDTNIELKPTTFIEPVTRIQPSIDVRSTKDPNEIVLTFNTVVTEVFPMELFNIDIDRIQSSTSSTNDRVNSFHELIKNVPKSLTITLA